MNFPCRCWGFASLARETVAALGVDRPRAGDDQLRGGVRMEMAEGEVTAFGVDEEVRQHEDNEDGRAEEDHDQKKVRLVGAYLFYFHSDGMRARWFRWFVVGRYFGERVIF